MPNIAEIDDIRPVISGVSKHRDVTKYGVLYDDHSLYEKHLIYYGAAESGEYPDFTGIEDIVPDNVGAGATLTGNVSVSDIRPINCSVSSS